MNSINFLFAIHNHQPVGNFDFVIEDAYQKSYKPFLEVLARHPSIKIGVHNSGCLIDWFENNRPEYLDRLGELVDRGQVELITGGYYEPILPSIPESDREGQIRKLSTYLESRFKRRPRGLWLTERVWEPSLVGPLVRAGVEYTMVDDTHFIAAGVPASGLWGPYLTEDQGEPLYVFPISKELRYSIPFRPPQDTVDILSRLAAEEPGRSALLGDDGEKFGVWPHTYQLVYEQGWLDSFFTLIEENRDWIHMRFPSEVIDREPPQGKVYLPTASYDEMMEWALPARAQQRFHDFRTWVGKSHSEDSRFVRGGFWRNFFARYPESDHLNKRMLLARKEVERAAAAGSSEAAPALEAVWSSQCNCAYWHGVFGGLYLPHLRNALFENILEAEHRVESGRHGTEGWTHIERSDFDCDGDREVFLRNPDLTLVAAPAEGGALHEISVKPLRLALGNGLTRRPEAYHEKLRRAAAEAGPHGAGNGGGDGAQSIHDRVLSKEEGLERYLHYDTYRRASLVDHFLRDDATLDGFRRGDFGEQGDFLSGEFETAAAQQSGEAVLSMSRLGHVWRKGTARRVSLEKRLRLPERGGEFSVEYTLQNEDDDTFEMWFGVEWNFSMLAGNSPTHHYDIPGVPPGESHFASAGETKDATGLALVDEHRKIRVALSFTPKARLWRAPVETVSLSEGGFERIYQSSAVFPHWRLRMAPGNKQTIAFSFTAVRTGG